MRKVARFLLQLARQRVSDTRQRVIEEANSSLYGFLDALPAVYCGKPRGTQVL
jgi:hypothetical protein